MKAIILAAGRGRRMGEYGENLPKSLLPFAGRPLIEHQIETLRAGGVSEIVLVTGFKHELMQFPNCRTYHNPEYATTNMIESLLCARDELAEPALIAYADILYTPDLVRKMIAGCGEVDVAVDEAWREYWTERFGTTETDLESLSVTADGRIDELGRPLNSSEGVLYRYVGLLRFGSEGFSRALALYDRKQCCDEGWSQSGKSFRNGYMTDLINELIASGGDVRPVTTRHGWLEFDTAEDYELACKMLGAGTISRFLEIGADR
jgi:L-glutamine-phosphate cytidylyltransferase